MSVRCLLLGHADLLESAHRELYLRCSDCGRRTNGWDLGRCRYRVTTDDWPLLGRVRAWCSARALIGRMGT